MGKWKGRKYELELKRLLEEKGCTVIDVASTAGLTGQFDADLLVWTPAHEPTEGWQRREDEHMIELEVKYRKNAQGYAQTYDAHLEACGMGGLDYIKWRDCRTGGALAMIDDHEGYGGEGWECDGNALTAFIQSAFKPGVDVVACRAPKKPWLFFWT